jgi:LytS/YehU family sensor histidine kinase
MWKRTTLEAESLRAENLQTELDLLKVQLNPHFLFNAFGSLSSLIDEDPLRAKAFLEQLSVVYRYLLQSNEKSLTTLKEELEFIGSYAALLKTRFGDGLAVSIQIRKEEHYEYLMPALTIQLFLENAVKHNVVVQSRPLQVLIYTDEDANLVVENNLQKKTSMAYSSKRGLSNVIAKYKILTEQSIDIEETREYFRVAVPLIRNKLYAGIDH